MDNPEMLNQTLSLRADSLYDHEKYRFFLNLVGGEIITKKINVNSSKNQIYEFMRKKKARCFAPPDHDSSVHYYFDELCFMCIVRQNDTMTEISVAGIPFQVEQFVESIRSSFTACTAHVRWIYDPQYLESMKVMIPNRNLPFDEMYPFLNGETLDSYYARYMRSDASILLLLGQPGTGKTSFLRGLLHSTNQNAILTYNAELLKKDNFFATWFESTEENIVIIEDADTLLLPREDGNDMMARFLNLGDGLLSFGTKKMIFTTNLPSVASIDQALIRPGRCHDIIDFKPLSREQAMIVSEKAGHVLNKDGKEFTIAEIFGEARTNRKHQSFGFI